MRWKDVAARSGAGVRGAFGATRRGILAAVHPGRTRRVVATLVAIVLVAWFLEEGIVRVREGDVGVIVDNLTGRSEVADAVGYRFVFPIVQSFWRLDRKVQSLVMAEQPEAGFRGGDAVKLKTKDGSDVSIDVLVSFHLVASGAAEILRDAGDGTRLADLWVRTSVRAMVARAFGELTAESIYNANERNAKAAGMLKTLNQELAPQHVEVLAITPRDVRFFSAYEDIIKKKKIKDQETQQYLSEARLAEQRQRTEVAQAEFEAKQSVQRAQGDADKARAEADGYARRVALEADGELTKALKEAEGQLAIGLAEAQGIKEQASALGGAGGVNLVALAYAKKLAGITISGIPVMQDPTQGNVRVQQIGALQSQPQTNAGPPPGVEMPPNFPNQGPNQGPNPGPIPGPIPGPNQGGGR